MTKKVVKDTEVDLLELILAKLQGVTTSVTKATMLKMQGSINYEAQQFFKLFGTHFYNAFSRMSDTQETISWLNTSALKLGYRQNKPLTSQWKRKKYIRRNPDKRFIKMDSTDVPARLFRYTGDLKEDLRSMSKASNLGSYLYKHFGGVTSTPLSYSVPLGAGFTTNQKGQLFDSSGRQQRYEVLLSKELKNRFNYGSVSPLPGTGTAPASKAGRYTARPHRGTISTAQAAFEGRLLAGMSFSILSKLSSNALRPQNNDNYLGDLLAAKSFISKESRIKLGALKRHSKQGVTRPKMQHYLLEPFFAALLSGPEPESLNSRLNKVVKRYKRKR